MKNLWLIMFIVACCNCNSGNRILKNEDIMQDSSNFYVFKSDRKKATGILKTQIQESYHVDEVTRETTIEEGKASVIMDYDKNHSLIGTCDLKDGKLEGEYKMFYPNGRLKTEFYMQYGKPNGLLRSYDEYGQLEAEKNYKNGFLHGIAKFYRNGMQVEEIVYENGNEVKSYKFDSSGNKIIPITECLEVVEYKTGYYEYVDYNHGQVLYQPIVILKIKNVSNKPLKETIKITAVFITDDEEWSNESVYFQSSFDTPLQPNISRQISVKSSVGWTNFGGIGGENVVCKMMVNGDVFQTFKIINKLVISNRL